MNIIKVMIISMMVMAGALQATSPSQNFTSSKGDFSEIRISKILPQNFTPRITDSRVLVELPQFNQLIEKKIECMPEYFLHYSYTSEGVDDTSWGCAWRAIQTLLSPHYHQENQQVPSFKEMYETYGSRSFLEKELVKHYKINPDETWLAPHEEWHMWGDAIIGQMIAQSFGMQNRLVTLNEIPDSLMPKVSDEVVDFKTLKEMIFDHFINNGDPIYIDNGRYAMNILGVGETDGTFFLLIGDPHLIFERDEDPLNGLYVVGLDDKGRQVSLDYPAIHNHFDADSYKTLNFTHDTKWNFLFTK